MARARSDHNPLDGSPALEAREVGSPVDHESLEIVPGPPVWKQVREIIETGPAVVDRRFENDANRGEKTIELARR